jgi:hypothetical protein
MASSPLVGTLSSAQIAVVQQARQAIRPQGPAQKNELAQTQAQKPVRSAPPRCRGQIIDITV